MLSITEIDALIADKEFKGFKRICLTLVGHGANREQLEILSNDEDDVVRKFAALNPALGVRSRKRLIKEFGATSERTWNRNAERLLPENAD